MNIVNRTKLTKKEREEVGDLLIYTLIVEAHCKKAYMAAGESEISRTDLKRSGVRSVPLIRGRQMQRLLLYLIDRGHIERTNDRDLIRPVRGDKMPLG
jgi:hypothetical protein